MTKARPLEEWHEDFGPVLWWRFPIVEPPWVGTPLDCSETVRLTINETVVYASRRGGWPGYHTHWTPLPWCPDEPMHDQQPHGEK